jgi:hypothetical protein
MLNPRDDVRKTATAIRHQIENNLKCMVLGCENPLTMFRGPSENKLCREHQIQLREYGGLARTDRLYTFFKNWVCEGCGYDPRKDPWFDNPPPTPWDDEEHKLRAMRAMLVCDHIIRRSDGGTDTKENTQTFCQNCNAKKTINEKDYHRGTPVL